MKYLKEQVRKLAEKKTVWLREMYADRDDLVENYEVINDESKIIGLCFFDDIIVGEWGNDVVGNNAGRVFIYSGFDGSTIRVHSGDSAGVRFGLSLSGLGDINSDGRGDYVIGAPQFDSGGAAYVFSGIDGDGRSGARLRNRGVLHWTRGGSGDA